MQITEKSERLNDRQAIYKFALMNVEDGSHLRKYEYLDVTMGLSIQRQMFIMVRICILCDLFR